MGNNRRFTNGTEQPRQNKLTYLSGYALRWLCKMPPPLTKLNRSTVRLRL